jgi:hypothetical protein
MTARLEYLIEVQAEIKQCRRLAVEMSDPEPPRDTALVNSAISAFLRIPYQWIPVWFEASLHGRWHTFDAMHVATIRVSAGSLSPVAATRPMSLYRQHSVRLRWRVSSSSEINEQKSQSFKLVTAA